jgi:hypothetical protein
MRLLRAMLSGRLTCIGPGRQLRCFRWMAGPAVAGGMAQFPPCPRIGAGCCERAAGSRSAQRPRSGAGGVLGAAVRERIMGQPGQGRPGMDGGQVFRGGLPWRAGTGGRPRAAGLRRRGSQAYLGPRAHALCPAT